MFITHLMKRLLTTSLLSFTVLSLSTTIVFAGDLDKITWSSLLPEESNISLQQKHVMKGLEVTLEELNSVIERELKNNKITNDTDFTVNEDVALVYDYLMYRIFELIKVDNRIKEELVAQEATFRNNEVSMDMVKKHFSVKEEYENKEVIFFSLVDKLRRAVYIKDLRAEVRNVQSSIKDLTSAMNRYSSYRNRLASR